MRLALGAALVSIGLIGLLLLLLFSTFMIWAHHMYTVGVAPDLILWLSVLVALAVGCTTTGVWVLITRRWRAAAQLDPSPDQS